MNATENEHDWFSHQLATYLAGGLSDLAERARFEAHAAACDRCAADLHHAQQLEGKMSELFAVGIPDSDFEQRIATRLRFRLDRRQWVNPKVRKAAIAAAAVLMFGGWGYVAQNFVEDGKLPSFDTSPTQFAMGLKDRLMGTPADRPAIAMAPLQQVPSAQSTSSEAPATMEIGAFYGRTGGTTGVLTVIPKTGGLERTEVVKTESNNAERQRVVRVQSGGTFRLGTPDDAPQNAGSITSAATNLLKTANSGGTIGIRNAADADGDGISDNAPIDAFKSAPGAAWAGNRGTIAGQILNNGAVVSTSNTKINGPESVYWAGGRNLDVDGTTVLAAGGTINSSVRFNLPANGSTTSGGGTTTMAGQFTMGNTFTGNTTISSNAPAYVFQGAGKITGDATLRKTGSGTLFIDSVNDFTGGTTITEGTIALGRDNRNDKAAGTLSTVYSDNHSVAMNQTANGQGSSIVSSGKLPTNTVTVNAGTLDFAAPGQISTSSANSAQRVAQGSVIAGKVNITPARQLDIRGTNFYGVNAGTLTTSTDANGIEARASEPAIAMAGGGVSLAGDRNAYGNNGAASLNITQGAVRMNSVAGGGWLYGNPLPKDGTLTVTGSGAFDVNGRNDQVVLNGDVAFKPNAQGTGSIAYDGKAMNSARFDGSGSTLTVNGNVFPGNGNLRSGNGTLLSSSGTIQSPGVNTPKTISIDGPFSINETSPIESKSENLAFKPADAFALNQPAKPLSIGNIQAGGGPAQKELPSLQTAAQDHSTGLTVVGNLTTSVSPQVAERLGRVPIIGDLGSNNSVPASRELNRVYGGTVPNQTTPSQSQGSLATRDQLAQAVSQPVGGPAGDANSGRAVAAQAQANAAAARRVIREGTMEFEVDSFDSTFNQIATIVGEEGGFIAAADSDKLPNGKVRGMVTVRVPPDRLDLLVLKLRALGELKSQKLGSRDVGKEYTDLESELRAARAMEARLLEMIAKAQGKVAELLEAEKELANWRTKIEKMTGTLNYYNNLISMATLNLQLYEKDIRTPASANITEEISTGVETEDVEAARNAALKAIDEAKGRIIESNLQKLEAGQFAAKIIAEVAPENAGPIIDRLKQLGRLARYDVQKKQTTEGAKTATAAQAQPPVRLETIPTRIVISLYNLANVAPRLTNNLNIAGDDVEAVYRAILKRVNDANGRVISSNLNRQDRAQVTGTMQFEIKSADADAVLNDVRLQGIVLRMVVNENPDTANVTTAKQAFVLSIIPTAQLSAKHFANMNLAAEDVEAAYGAILKRINASAGSRVISSNLNRQDASQINGTIQFELKSEDADAVINDLRLQGLVLRMNVGENADGMNVTTVKRSYTLQVVPMATLSPKLTTNLNLAAADVEGMYNSILKIVSSSAGSRVLSSNLSRQDATQAVGSLQFEVKSEEAPAVLGEIRKNVQVLQLNLLENPDNANVTTAKQAFVVQIIPTSQVQPREVRELGIQTSEVESAVQVVSAAVANANGRMIDSNLSQDKNGTTIARLAIEVPLDKTEQIADLIRKQGTVRSTNLSRNTQIPDGPLSRARLNVTLATGETIVPSEGGFGASIREGLSTSVKGLLWSLQLIVIGVCLVAPWLLLMWGGWRMVKKRKRATPGV